MWYIIFIGELIGFSSKLCSSLCLIAWTRSADQKMQRSFSGQKRAWFREPDGCTIVSKRARFIGYKRKRQTSKHTDRHASLGIYVNDRQVSTHT